MPDNTNVQRADDHFSHGASYPEENDKIRPTPCASCAFVSTPESVRPDDISIADLEAASADYDDFLCHCADANGEVYTCAGWAARFGDTSAEVQRKIVSE
jgi:hypothetical protein